MVLGFQDFRTVTALQDSGSAVCLGNIIIQVQYFTWPVFFLTFSVSECGSTIYRNCTYISNPGYPSTYGVTAQTTCEYVISGDESKIS